MLDTVTLLDSQSSIQASYGFSKDIYDQSRINAFDELRKSKARFRNNQLHWEQIPRANDPSKPLQEKAANILATIVHKLRKAPVVTLNHNYLSRLTKCAKDQNVNLLKQLADILDISFHAKTIIDDKIYRNCYVIKHTLKGQSIIENSSVLLKQKHFVGSRAVTPVQALPTEETKTHSRAEFIPSLSIYKEKVFKKDRSIKSNFCKNSFFKKGEGSLRVSKDAIPVVAQTKTAARSLEEFYPLSSEDASSIRSACGREFTLNAMNEILLDMSKRVKDRWFKSKKGFLSYMAKVFTYEKRDAVKIGNESFRIIGNKTGVELTIAKQDEFLSQIEYSPHVSPEWLLKKKICSVLTQDKAYNLLKNLKYCGLNKNVFEVHLIKPVIITDSDKEIILENVKMIYEEANRATKIDFKILSSNFVETLVFEKNNTTFLYDRISNDKNPSIWHKIRQELIAYYGEVGEGLDTLWFSNLQATEVSDGKEIILKSPNEFIADKIEQNYLDVINKLTCDQGYKLSFC